MHDLDQWVPIQEAVRAEIGRRFHQNTFPRWYRIGIKTSDGARTKLVARKIAGRWLTTQHEVRKFFQITTDRELQQDFNSSRSEPESAAKKRRADAIAARELQRAGI